jgi:DNA-binding PadR family transcriptional regulator
MRDDCGPFDSDDCGRIPPIPPIPPLAVLAAMAGAWGARGRGRRFRARFRDRDESGEQEWQGQHGPFGEHGPFGKHGPFGRHGPFGPGGPWGPGGKGPRGPRGRFFSREQLRLVLLTLLAEQPRHGYDLIKALEELSGGHYSPSPGVIYPALSMLADEGLIAEQASDDARRKFGITEAGTKELEGAQSEAEAAMARLKDLGERAERHRSPPVERASFNLFAAVSQRMRQGGDEELAHKVAEVLDEAAQRIERL